MYGRRTRYTGRGPRRNPTERYMGFGVRGLSLFDPKVRREPVNDRLESLQSVEGGSEFK